ncbi:hypothetical protein [Pseudomonas sp. BBP2017]|uniref:hypothetical protein n=1 Tax=Pseudomonas sp. BBP2017 TaxID=2109731 RepID=UPI000D121352|nr:hypothetical protein [Pseudomonas sp. BBP2017]PSS46190.1 hypothetical protein C6382_23395 [Pseudomonas sp. BBP2017]
MDKLEVYGLKPNRGNTQAEQIFQCKWRRPNEKFEEFTGHDTWIDYEFNEGHIQIVGQIIRGSNWVVVNIPETYADRTYDIITFDEGLAGKEGVVLATVLDSTMMSDYNGTVTFARDEKFTVKFSAKNLRGYEFENGYFQFNSY